MRPLLLVLLLVAAALLIGSRFYPNIEQVSVSGNAHFEREQILGLANLEPGDPLLWVNRWSVSNLVDDPWIRRARVIRHWPDTVSVVVWERTPVLTDGVSSWAADGTILPDVDEETRAGLVLLDGWGEPRVEEALRLLALLSTYEPRVISYSPEGFDIELAQSTLFTPSAAMLERHWAAWTNQRGSRVAVYPWGVSEINE